MNKTTTFENNNVDNVVNWLNTVNGFSEAELSGIRKHLTSRDWKENWIFRLVKRQQVPNKYERRGFKFHLFKPNCQSKRYIYTSGYLLSHRISIRLYTGDPQSHHSHRKYFAAHSHLQRSTEVLQETDQLFPPRSFRCRSTVRFTGWTVFRLALLWSILSSRWRVANHLTTAFSDRLEPRDHYTKCVLRHGGDAVLGPVHSHRIPVQIQGLD